MLWEKVASDNGLNQDEVEKYWKSRSRETLRKANYGSGSFIAVEKRSPAAEPSTGTSRQLTDEDWWEMVGPSDRTLWLIANFVETGGYFEILRTDATNCRACAGRGHVDGPSIKGAFQRICVQCNGCGTVRSVTYR